MSQTRQSLIDAACFIAKQEGIDQDVVADVLLPRVFYHVVKQAAANPARRALVMVTNTVALVNGTIALPTTILTEFMRFAAVSDPIGATMANKMRYVANWNEFIRPLDLTLGYFTVVQLAGASQFYMTRPGTAYTPGAGYTGSIDIIVPTIPTIPAAAATAIACNGEIEDDLVLALAAALKGGWMDVVANKGAAA